MTCLEAVGALAVRAVMTCEWARVTASAIGEGGIGGGGFGDVGDGDR